MIYTISSIAPICQDLKAKGQKLVLATGFFDLLHSEHIKFLEKAKAVGDVLIIGVESDSRARAVKGDGRPVEPQNLRCQHILSLPGKLLVLALPDNFNNQQAYEDLLIAVQPDIYAVSSHTSYLDNKKTLVEKHGGQLVVVHDFNPQVSTSQILASRQNKV